MITIQQHVQACDWPVSSWEEAETFARQLVDAMECPIDEGILPTVVALNLLGLHTCQSCEGHLDYGAPYPWIDFETDEFPAFKQAQEDADREDLSVEEREKRGALLVALAQSLTAHSRGQVYERLEKLLCTYYEQHPAIAEEQQMVIRWCSPIFFRMMPFCWYDPEEYSETACAEHLARAQAEMQALGRWLRERWQLTQCSQVPHGSALGT